MCPLCDLPKVRRKTFKWVTWWASQKVLNGGHVDLIAHDTPIWVQRGLGPGATFPLTHDNLLKSWVYRICLLIRMWPLGWWLHWPAGASIQRLCHSADLVGHRMEAAIAIEVSPSHAQSRSCWILLMRSALFNQHHQSGVTDTVGNQNTHIKSVYWLSKEARSQHPIHVIYV